MSKSTQAVWVDGKPPDSIIVRYQEMVLRIGPLNRLILNLAQHARGNAELESRLLSFKVNLPIHRPDIHPYPPIEHLPKGAFVAKEVYYWLDDQMTLARKKIIGIFNSAEPMGPVQMEIINSEYINPHTRNAVNPDYLSPDYPNPHTWHNRT